LVLVGLFYTASNPNRGAVVGRDRMVVGFTTTCTISAYHPGPDLGGDRP